MPFREDSDAAHARVDALSEEVAELKAERDALLAERQAAKREPAGSAAPSNANPSSAKAADPVGGGSAAATPGRDRARWISAVVTVVFIGIAVGGGIYTDYAKAQRGRAYDAAVTQWRNLFSRWPALLATEPCTRAVLEDEWQARPALNGDFKHAYVDTTITRLATNCLDGASYLAADPTSSAVVKAELGEWLAAEKAVAVPAKALSAYFSHQDWKDDDYRGARTMLATLAPLLEQRRAALASVREHALPELRAEIRAKRDAHAAAHSTDETVWRIDIGLELWDVENSALDASGASGNPPTDAAIQKLRDAAAKLLADSAGAPVAVRRELRTFDSLSSATGTAPLGVAALSALTTPSSPDILAKMRDKMPDPPPRPVKPTGFPWP